jgi:YggT family protein
MRSLLGLIDLVLLLFFWVLLIYVVVGLLINFGIVSGVYEFLMRVCEPVLRPIRRILPNFGPVDLSPLVVVILIWFLRSLLAEYGPLLIPSAAPT